MPNFGSSNILSNLKVSKVCKVVGSFTMDFNCIRCFFLLSCYSKIEKQVDHPASDYNTTMKNARNVIEKFHQVIF
jgi:hypothetical protein